MKSEINPQKELLKGALTGIGALIGSSLLIYLMNKGGNQGGSI